VKSAKLAAFFLALSFFTPICGKCNIAWLNKKLLSVYVLTQ
jgi:hypothetical protein